MATRIVWAVEEEMKYKERRALIFGILLGLTLGSSIVWALTRPAEAVVDVKVEKGCKLPKFEGEATTFLVVDNKMRCYRYY